MESVMPLPRSIAAFNRRFTNRLVGRFAARVPTFAVIVHQGRSGRVYRTPVNVFRTDGRYLVALTYGVGAGWVRNVLSGRPAELLTGGLRLRIGARDLVHDPAWRVVPLPWRLLRIPLRPVAVRDFLLLQPLAASPGVLAVDPVEGAAAELRDRPDSGAAGAPTLVEQRRPAVPATLLLGGPAPDLGDSKLWAHPSCTGAEDGAVVPRARSGAEGS
jgi:hypothetical protein